MPNITTTKTQATLLPVLDILNNVITINAYLSAVRSAKLPDSITSNPSFNNLVTDYTKWQYNLWEQYYISLVDLNIVAQAQEIKNLLGDGITTQSVIIDILNISEDTPSVISLSDDVATQINDGTPYITQLEAIANQIKHADKEKIASLTKLVDTLSSQFDQMEDKLTDKAIDEGKDLIVSVINVAVAVGTEQDPIDPLVKGVSQVGTDIVKELILSSEINNTLIQLETAWKELDEETTKLAHIELLITRLNKVVGETTKTITALNAITTDWQTISDTVNSFPSDWTNSGILQVTEWSNRMSRVSFAGAISQTVSSN